MRGRTARTMMLSAFAAAALLMASGCRTAAPLGNGGPRRETATLKVENDDINDRVIYVVMGDIRQRLGIARGVSTTTFTIPATFVVGSPQVRFLANVLGGIHPTVSERAQAAPGDTVEMVIMGS